MEKPNEKDYKYSNGEWRDFVEYVEQLECYIEFLEKHSGKRLFERYSKEIEKLEKEVDRDHYLYENYKEEWLRRIKYIEGKLFVFRHY